MAGLRTDATGCKVGRLLEENGLDGLGAELERRWVGDGRESQSLRDLAEWFNARLLEARMEAAGMNPVSGESENYYRLLTAEQTSSGERVQARRSLERAGVDVDRLTGEFVSYGAVYTYLTEYRGASKGTSGEGDPVTSARRRVQRLQKRTEAVSESAVASLRDAGHLDVGDVDVRVSVHVTCDECGDYYPAAELLERGGCACRAGE